MKSWNKENFEEAYQQALKSLQEGGIPIGSSLEINGQLIASGHNERVQKGDPIAHGEMSCLRKAGRQKSYRDSVLYTTLAPCAMCTGTIVQFGIPKVVVGEDKTFAGEIDFLKERGVEVLIINDERCIKLMEEFKNLYPEIWAEDIGEEI